MDGCHAIRFFLKPKQTLQRQYEALRAVFVDGEPLDHVAERFGYKSSSLRSMASRFRADCRRGVTPPFFSRMGAGDLSGRLQANAAQAPKRPKSRTVES
jgi:hypothetical protein